MIFKSYLFILILLVLVTPAAPAAESLTNLTLDQAIQIALEKHPGLSEANAELQAAEVRRKAAGKLSNPEIIARMESAPMRAGTTSQAEYVAGVSQAIPLGNRLGAAKELAKAELTSTLLEKKAEIWRISKKVRDSFATALFASEVLSIQANLATTSSELYRITKLRVEAGDLPPLDLSRIAAEQAQNELQLHETRRNHEQALREVALALGLKTGNVTSLSGNLQDILQFASIQNWLTNTSTHPLASLTESRMRNDEKRLQLAKAERVPDLNLDLIYRRLQAQKENAFDAGISIAIPIFNRKSRVREAEHKLAAAEARNERTQMDLRHEMQSRELALVHGTEVAVKLRDGVIPKIEEALRGAEARYQAGDLPLNDLLLVRREAANARLQYLTTLREIMEARSGLAGRL
ncbi:MAG: TolC family protein [Verrucomicrobiales bacterium]